MADGEKRIVELTETQTFGNGDYLPLDNISNSETKKIEAKKLGITYTMTDTEDGFSFDGSNGYHYEKVIPKDAQMSYEDYEALTEAEKMDGSNRFIPDYPEEEKQPEIWQRVGRTPLTTVEKTISPAINELKGRIDDSDTEIEEIKSNLIDFVDVTVTTTSNSDVAPFSCFGETTLDSSIDITKVVGATIYDASLSYKNPAQAYVYTTSRRIRVYTKTAVTLTVRVLVKR